MDIEAFGKERTGRLGEDCIGTAPGNTCHFLEFVDYMQPAGKNLDKGQSTSIGTNLWPDAADGVRALGKLTINGQAFVPFTNPKLSPSKTFGSPEPKIGEILESTTDWIQAARAKLNDQVPRAGVSKARAAITSIHEGRLAENAPHEMDVLNDYLRDVEESNTQVEKHVAHTLDGYTYQDVDIVTTKAKDPSFA